MLVLIIIVTITSAVGASWKWPAHTCTGHPSFLLVDVLRYACRSAVSVRELFGELYPLAYCHCNELIPLAMSVAQLVLLSGNSYVSM